MPTDKRQRQKEGRQARLDAERAAAARSRRIKGIRNAVIFAAIVVIVLLVLSWTSRKDKSDESVKANDTTSTTNATSTKAKADVCPATDGSAKRTISFSGSLKYCLRTGQPYTARITTSEGRFDVALQNKRTPKTTNAFATLARWKYYDGTKIFRTEKATGIIQGGSPHTQDNSDQGPGFVIPDEGTFTSADYGPGALAMARTAQPDSATGQFFLLSGEGARYLGDKKNAAVGKSAGTYVVFGKVTSGLDVLKRIAALDDGTGKPKGSKAVTITKVQILEP